LECSGTDKAADITVAPVVMRGTWDHVLLKLMEGSGLNYVASNPGASYKGKLLIQGPALAIPKQQAGLSPETPATAAFVPPSDDTQSPENLSETAPEVRQGITNSAPVSTASAAADRQGAGSAGMN